MTVNLFSNWVRSTPRFRDHRPIILDRKASERAHDLSLTDWRDWLPWALPPFDKSFIQIDPRAYIPGDDIIEAMVISTFGDHAQIAVQGQLEDKTSVMMSPFTINWNLDPTHYVPVPDNIAELGWSPAIVKAFGVPKMPRVGGNPSKLLARLDVPTHAKLCYEFAGQVRVALAAMALINMYGDWDAIPERAPLLGRKRSKYHQDFIPVFGTHVITLDLTKRKRKPKRAGRAGTPKCEHDVRGHFKHYRSESWDQCRNRHTWNDVGPRQVCNGCGSRRKWVPGFRRGDPERGSTVATYEVKA